MNEEIFTNDDMILLQSFLRNNKQTITCAESCTGGMIASMITQASGSSSIFKGSVVTYCNEIKEQELGVSKQTMIDNGAVSVEVVNEMLRGVLKKFDASYAVAVSGVAGPGGGTKNKPVGTVVIGMNTNTGEVDTDVHHFEGDRISVQKQAAQMALKKVLKFIQKTLDK
ncbi:MAG: CinA family protein [Campylobacterota bacterium]|nr:CinA family protein [Campylobacterota bacterium]